MGVTGDRVKFPDTQFSPTSPAMSTRASRKNGGTTTFQMLGMSGSAVKATGTGFAPWAADDQASIMCGAPRVADKQAEVIAPANVVKRKYTRAPLGEIIEGKRSRKQAEYPGLVVGAKAEYACAPRGRPPTYINWSNKKKSEDKPEKETSTEMPLAPCTPEQLKQFFSELPSPVPQHA